jgi:hypothetical protein
LAKKEKSAYDFLHQNPPDIIFKLIADVNIIAARKPNETSLNMLNKKLQGIKDLQFPGHCKIVEINANLPLTEVLFEIRKNIWESYE